MYEAPKNLWIEWMTEISEILRWTNVNTFVRQLTCLEVKTRTKPWWLLRNHWHQKVHTVGEFSKDAPAYLSVWISKFPRRSIKLQQLPTSTRNSRKMKKKKGGCAIFPMKIASGTNPSWLFPDFLWPKTSWCPSTVHIAPATRRLEQRCGRSWLCATKFTGSSSHFIANV